MTVLLAVLLILASFYVLALVTEHYFIPAIDILAGKLRMSSDAAGATLLAMGSSAPEFFTSLIAVLGISGDHANIGAGAVVGSAIFNVLLIIGVAAMFKEVSLQWQPASRDLVFYIITILLLLFAFRDGKIYFVEALLFVITYLVYVIAVVGWRKVLKYKIAPPHHSKEATPEEGLVGTIHDWIQLVIPDVRKRPKHYIITFFTSILMIAGLSWLLVEQVVLIAHTLNINETFLALTVLSAGTSVPDLIGSVVVAKQGRGDMAVGNAIGSNIYDILVCLGVPWLLVLGWRGGNIAVSNENLQASIILLFATVIAVCGLLIAKKWNLNRTTGGVLVALYFVYVGYLALEFL